MPVTINETGDHLPQYDHIAPNRIHISVAQLPDGRVSGVDVYANAPAEDEILPSEPRATVWTVPVPDVDDTDPSAAAKVLDLALTNTYRDDDGHGWSEGERHASNFYADHAGERTFLRTVEAHLIRAGYLDAHTGMVACQSYGLNISDDDLVMKWSEGWKWVAIGHDADWAPQPDVLAPADASPRRVANAIIDNLASLDVDLYERLPLHHRARVYVRTFGWRARLHRIAYRLTRFRRTVRARIPR
ncbi:hypothetical protein KUF83_30230 [Streptomyces sp. BV286]|uniref:hypothetical protein n=1 Tax=Streptomyces sp. BV286 TaxID=2849672 RepID=UPI001C2EF46B|nr:hypothetical protein [Streptomyces sp. BV286]MBV1940815.1 hypothetical protein [Streptomyces sp. BV286]